MCSACSKGTRTMFDDKDIYYARRLSHVPRWAVMPTVRRQSVAEHTFHVAMLAGWLVQFYPVPPGVTQLQFEADVLYKSLAHDLNEAVTGDHPSPTKKADNLPMSDVHVVLKCADILEAICFIEEEARLGNRYGVDELSADLFARFHGFWQRFKWSGPGVKPLTSDMIKMCLQACLPMKNVHPVMDHENATSRMAS